MKEEKSEKGDVWETKTEEGGEEDALTLFKCLGDDTRFAILRQLYREDCYVELIASRLGLTPGTICHHLKKLEAAGLVRCSRTQYYMIYSLNRAVFSRRLEDYLKAPAAELEADKEAGYRKKVIDTFLPCGRLTKIPSQMKKREIVWRYLIEKNFEPGRTYTEREVDEAILQYHEDTCTIRRDFISMGLMIRDHETYRVVK